MPRRWTTTLALAVICAALLASSSCRSTAFAQPAPTSLLASQVDLSVLATTGSVNIDFLSILPNPCVCTLEYQPWCADDGKVYGNKCSATKCGTQEAIFQCNIDFQGTLEEWEVDLKACELQCENQSPEFDTCLCTLEYQPWCAEDGLVYPNECTASKCQTQKPLYPCSIDYSGTQAEFQADLAACEATCGSKFKTAFSLNIASPCLCTAEFNPTCSSDGTVASNPCLATKCGTQQALFSCDIDFENPKASYDDEIQECEELCLAQAFGDDDCICTLEYMPWCGEDGEIYSNECSATKCQTQKAIFPCPVNLLGTQEEIDEDLAECKAECSGEPIEPEPCLCTLEYMPWCGEDGVVYPNKCFAEKCSTQEALFPCPFDPMAIEESFELCKAQCAAAVFSPLCSSSDCFPSFGNDEALICPFAPPPPFPPPDDNQGSGGSDPTQFQKFPLKIAAPNTIVKPVPLPSFPLISTPAQALCLCLVSSSDPKWCSSDGNVYDNECLAGCGEKEPLFMCNPELTISSCEQVCETAPSPPSPPTPLSPSGLVPPAIVCPTGCGFTPSGNFFCAVPPSTAASGDEVCLPPTLCGVEIEELSCSQLQLGDVNSDLVISVQDIVQLVAAVVDGFDGPCVRELGDLDGDGSVAVQDIILAINTLLS